MNFDFTFFAQSILLGAGLAMDAFSVSLANGLNEPRMKVRKMCIIAAIFAFFQALMPMIGWVCVHTVVQYFHAFEKLIPWIALGLLGFIGGKMLYEGITQKCEDGECCKVCLTALLVQGVATSIDALSVGFTIAEYGWIEALLAAAIIALVTFIICVVGVYIGTRAGTKLAGKAGILGGSILIFIGFWIFIKSWF
ncbi:MAG: manganese efflux pump [Clostridia bacterium]|nr:manganese efflux pump [Clostridia bacterium]